jgi:predicted DCC family thiol-disulfide oxidoreductase YuxK
MRKVRVYYNSACPVCNAGVTDQRRRMEGCSADVEWIDIHANPHRVEDIGASQEFVRKRLHVVDENGAVHIGSDAFHALWKRTPGQQHFARFIQLPGGALDVQRIRCSSLCMESGESTLVRR